MATVRLTAGRIREFEQAKSGSQSFLWDTDAPGLGIRATTGSKAFIFEGRLSKRRMRITLGDVRVMDIDDARAEARRLQTLIDQGIDPRDQKAEQLAEAVAKKQEGPAPDRGRGNPRPAPGDPRRRGLEGLHRGPSAPLGRSPLPRSPESCTTRRRAQEARPWLDRTGTVGLAAGASIRRDHARADDRLDVVGIGDSINSSAPRLRSLQDLRGLVRGAGRVSRHDPS